MPWFNHAKGAWATGEFCYWSSVTASFYATLVTGSYIPSESHVYASAFSGSELSSISFTAGYGGTGRLSIANRVLNINNLSNAAEFQCGTLVWSGLSAGIAAALVIFQQSGSDALSPLIAFTCVGGFPLLTNGTNLTYSTTSSGILDIVD